MTTQTNNFLRRRAGFILPFALAVTAVSAITAVMLISYFNSFSRNAYRAGARTRCRLAAQSAIEQTKIAIQNRFAAEAPTMMRTDPMMVSMFCDWFSTLSNASSSNTVVSVEGAGLESDNRTIKSPVKMDDCIVYVGILPTATSTNATQAILPITATAELTLPDKQQVTVTLMEEVRFYAGQNQVFNYAYFANNYGWMNANGATSDSFFINGDFRANGNISINGSTVNGFIYASANDTIGELKDGKPKGVEGEASVSAHYWAADHYHSNASKTMRPTDPVKSGGESWLGGYDAPSSGSGSNNSIKKSSATGSGTKGGTSGSPLINEYTDPIEMPMISELSGYVKYAQQHNGTLQCPAYEYTDSAGQPQKVSAKSVNAHYSDSEVGPSQNANLADKGALVLYGRTKDNPIIINGPVVVDSDVIVSGYIKGQGVIYSGRNIHVVGNVTYVNGPDWQNVNQGKISASTSVQNNEGKDLVCFIAKGNVVLGNYKDSSWMTDVRSYITNDETKYNTSQHDCDPSDANIGYDTHFGGDYTAVEKVGSQAKVRTTTETRTVQTGTDWWGNPQYGQRQVTVLTTTKDRRYYETVCDDAVLKAFSSTITELNGVFYNNHCVMGKIGDGSTKATIFGSLVCRNEAIHANTSKGLYFNWDNRLREGSPSHIAGLPLPLGLQTPHTYSWQEVPDTLNPVYEGQKTALNAL